MDKMGQDPASLPENREPDKNSGGIEVLIIKNTQKDTAHRIRKYSEELGTVQKE